MRSIPSVRVNTAKAIACFRAYAKDRWNGQTIAAQRALVEALWRAYKEGQIHPEPPSDGTFFYRWSKNQNSKGVPAGAWAIIEVELGCQPGELTDPGLVAVESTDFRQAIALAPVRELANLEMRLYPRTRNEVETTYNVEQTLSLAATVSFGPRLVEWTSVDGLKTYKAFVSLLTAQLRIYLEASAIVPQSEFGHRSGAETSQGKEITNMGSGPGGLACSWTFVSENYGASLKGKVIFDHLTTISGPIRKGDCLVLTTDAASLNVGRLLNDEEDEGKRGSIRAGVERRLLEMLTREQLAHTSNDWILCKVDDWLGAENEDHI